MLSREFKRFHLENPQVFNRLARLAFDLQDKGHKRGSIEMLFNVLRWETMMAIHDPGSQYKLNNNYKPFYARMLMDVFPALDGFFEIRGLRALVTL
tara:strand:+ start:9185 stop:9472 length:288 start_codon:yes stop_codon:yes gene_type:complete